MKKVVKKANTFELRIIKLKDKYGEEYYEIREVYYLNGRIFGCTQNPVKLLLYSKEDFGNLLGQIVEASKKPILELINDELIETNEVWTKEEI